MAEIKAQMTAVGGYECCAGCCRQFARGEQMSADEYTDGEPAGWFCGKCIAQWCETGEVPEVTHG